MPLSDTVKQSLSSRLRESSGLSDISRKYSTNPQSNKRYLAQLRLPMGLSQPIYVFEIQRL